MIVPIPFVIGLAALALAPELYEVLPGSGTLDVALAHGWLLFLPLLIGLASTALLGLALARGRKPVLGMRVALLALPASVPASFFAFLTAGCWLDFATRAAGESQFALIVLQVLPLLVLELLRLLCDQRLRQRLEHGGMIVPQAPDAREGMAMLAFLAAPLMLYGAGLDVVALDRRTEVFLHATSLGLTLGLAAFLLVLSFVLPLVFRLLMGTTRRLPPHLADDLQGFVDRIGFPSHGLLALDTGYRMVNAAMVGPLPWPRYLVLTDGLMSVLDAGSLRGVVAHEVGHAKAGHPALLLLLFVVIPLLLLHPVQQLDLEAADPILLALGGIALAGIGLFAVRHVGHRFEFEADVLSAEALGGAAPCALALRRVGELTQQDAAKSTLRHPSENARLRVLWRWETEPGFRERFHGRGRLLRRAIAVALLVVFGVTTWSWWMSWPTERAIYLFHTGDFTSARAQIEAAEASVRPGMREGWSRFRAEAAAAFELMPQGGEWERIREPLAKAAWERGTDILLREGPAAARPWLALATEAPDAGPLQETLWRWSEAAAEGDSDRFERLRAHLATMELPENLRGVVR